MAFDVQRVISAYQAGQQIKSQQEQKVRDVEDRDFELKQRQAQLKLDNINQQLMKRKLEQENAQAMEGQQTPLDMASMLQQIQGRKAPIFGAGGEVREAGTPVVPEYELLPEMQVSGIEDLGVSGYTARPQSMAQLIQKQREKAIFDSMLKRQENTVSVTDPTTGQAIIGPKDIIDNILTQTGVNERAVAAELAAAARQKEQLAATAARQDEQIAAAAARHADDMRQRELDRQQRMAAAQLSATSRTTNRPPTAANLRAFNFLMRAEDAVAELEKIEADIQNLGTGAQLWQKFAPNMLQSQLGQLYDQAQRQFTEARLRKDSGAAIPPHEYLNDQKTYFVQPGDTKDTLERKRKARQKLVDALKVEAGPAYVAPEKTGAPDDVDPAVWEIMTPEERKLWQN